MRVRRRGAAIIVEAPAKLNLFLETTGKRSDGYHDLETVMVPISIRDELILSPREDGEISIRCEWVDPASAKRAGIGATGDFPEAERNLAWRGAFLIRERFGVTRGVHLHLRKRIPMQAGLGGGSTDAAAALIGTAALFGISATKDELSALAAELGSDVPFFIESTPAIARGRGERLEALDSVERHMLSRMNYVVAKPPVGVSTAEAFAACRIPERPRSADVFREALRRGDREGLARATFNRLEEPARALASPIDRAERSFRDVGATLHAMTGSGSARFAASWDAATARRQYRRLRQSYDGWVEFARPWTSAGDRFGAIRPMR